jgi:uncharacterized protein (DUF433 family)
MAIVQEARRTSHPHVVKVDGVCGGRAIVEGTRIAVWQLVEYYYRAGMSVEAILADWDALSPAHVFDALGYYHDNREEIEQTRRENSYDHWQAQRAIATSHEEHR